MGIADWNMYELAESLADLPQGFYLLSSIWDSESVIILLLYLWRKILWKIEL